MRFPGTPSPTITRRTALLGTAAVGTTAVVPMSAASAAPSAAASRAPVTARTTAVRAAAARSAAMKARGGYVVRKVHRGDLPDAATRHMLSRFTGGVTKSRLADVTAAGGPTQWFEQQLVPSDIPDRAAKDLWNWFPVLAMTPQQKWARYKAGTQNGWSMMQDLASWIMMRRLTTKRQLEEMMVDFWSNLVHVASPDPEAWLWRVEYAQMIRENALGRFDDLLTAAVQHPSLGLFLNNVESTAAAINENLGREVLECYTVGVDAGYTEDDVVNSARILTGFHVDQKGTWAASYQPQDHWVGRVTVMGFSSPNAKADGRPVLDKYLKYLAHHPATAKKLCLSLAVRFVSDTPSDELVASLAKVYLDSHTAIVPVLRALVASSEFRDAAGSKVRTPVEDAVATWTAVQALVTKPHDIHDAANQFINVSKSIGQVVYDWPTPDGFPDLAPAWMGSGRILGSMRTHWYAASGTWPTQGISFPAPLDWMPQLPTTFDKVVDYVAGQALFLPSTATMLQAACVATDIQPNDVIDESHPLIKLRFPRLLVSILDTPEHLSR